MTSTNSFKNPMPECVVLDIDLHEPLLNWMFEQHGEDERLLYSTIVECLSHEKDADFELAYFLHEYSEHHANEPHFATAVERMARDLYEQVKHLRLHHDWYLDYRFDRQVNGALFLVKLPAYRVSEDEPCNPV
jgi:hypothetical protein